MSDDPPTYAEVGPRLEALGYEPIPVRPGGKRPGFDDWTQGGRVATLRRGREHWWTGILARTAPALDIDVRDRVLVRALHDLAVEMIGPAPVRVGQPPKALLPYWCIAPFAKRSREYVLPNENPDAPGYRSHKLEILASGQQWVCFAIHPGTRRAYRWYGSSPLDRPRVELTQLIEANADRYLDAADSLLLDRGARRLDLAGVTPESGGLPPASPNRGGKPPRPVETSDEAERIALALRRIPVDGLSYDDWVRIGLALKGALGEAGLPLWMWWSAQHPDNRPEDSKRKWRSFKPGRIGAGTLLYLEKLYGR